MRFRFPRLRRRGDSMPAPGPGTAYCGVCGKGIRYGDNGPNTDTMRSIMGGHECEPDRHYFDLGTNTADTDDWLMLRGYAWQPATDDVNDGLRLTRDGSPDVIVPMGSVLLWDGEQITVEEL